MSDKIKQLVDAIGALTVIEANELVKAIETEFGVSAAAPVMAVAAGAAADQPAAAEKTEFKVTLVSVEDKIPAIKAVRTIKKDLSLADAKALVESAPAELLSGVSKQDAEAAKKAFEGCATVKID